MLSIKTYLAPSSIHGIGLFAGENIKAGQQIWEFTPEYDRKFSLKDFESLPENIKAHFNCYAYLCKYQNCYIYLCDNAKFINHSKSPNTVEKPVKVGTVTVVLRDIAQGEEILNDYSEFTLSHQGIDI